MRAGRLDYLKFQVRDARVNMAPVAEALHLSQRERKRLRTVSADLWLTVEQTETWLKTLNVPAEARALAHHLQGNLVPLLRTQSHSVQAVEVAHQQEVEQRRDEVIIVGQPLEAPDLFRADASIGPHRLEPDLISYTVKDGALDLFVREEDHFGGTDGVFRQLALPVTMQFRRGLLSDMRASGEVLTGPEFQAHHPHHPLLKRKRLPAMPFLKVAGEVQELVILPEREAPHRWERYKETT